MIGLLVRRQQALEVAHYIDLKIDSGTCCMCENRFLQVWE